MNRTRSYSDNLYQAQFEVTIRVKTQQVVIREAEREDDLPIRRWRIELWLLDSKGQETDADIISSCIYQLHPSFKNPTRCFTECPFALEENGWGEFSIKINCEFLNNSGKFKINHFLDFEEDAYCVDYSVNIPFYDTKIREALKTRFKLPPLLTEAKLKTRLQPMLVKMLVALDEIEVTKVFKMILNDPIVQGEIERSDRHKPFYMILGQLPDELLDNIREYLEKLQGKAAGKAIEAEEVDGESNLIDEDVFAFMPEITNPDDEEEYVERAKRGR